MSATILLVEDDENDAFFLKRALQRAGVPNPIQRVCDGQEALDYFAGGAKFSDRSRYPLPGLVLLDLKLPHVPGMDVLKWIRSQAHSKSTVVVVFSASEHRDDIANAYRAGAEAYLVKPGTVEQLDEIAKTIRDSWLRTPGVDLPSHAMSQVAGAPAEEPTPGSAGTVAGVNTP